MGKNYKQIIEDLEKAIRAIKAQGISIEPLNLAIEELKSHSENIEAIENNIDAVKSEVITPIKTELEQNKKAGKFSIWGFYVGTFGLLVTAVSLLYTTFKEPIKFPQITQTDFNNSLKEITYYIHGLNDSYTPLGDEYLIGQLRRAILLQNDSIKISVEAYISPETKIKGRYYPLVSLTFFINEKQLGTKGLKEKIALVNNSGVSYYYDPWSAIWITENDSFIIFEKFKFEIKRIFRAESQILTVADKKDAVLIKRIE